MRVPLIMAGPKIPAGKRTIAMCYLLDLFPTLGEVAKLEIPKAVDGRSLIPVLTNPTAEHRDSIFLAYKNVQRSIRNDRYKLILYPRVGRKQLFDLQEDPFETRDLSTDERFAAIEALLREKMAAARAEFSDPHPLKVDPLDPAEIDLK
jgi:arylsulfatase A-like enzyme